MVPVELQLAVYRFDGHHRGKHFTCEVHFRALPEPRSGHPMVQIEVVT